MFVCVCKCVCGRDMVAGFIEYSASWFKKMMTKSILALLLIFVITAVVLKGHFKTLAKSHSHHESSSTITPDGFLSSSAMMLSLRRRRPRHRPRPSSAEHRDLLQISQYDGQIFLELQYVMDNVAIEMETLDSDNPTIIEFCRAVQQQVRPYSVYEVELIRLSYQIYLSILTHPWYSDFSYPNQKHY